MAKKTDKNKWATTGGAVVPVDINKIKLVNKPKAPVKKGK